MKKKNIITIALCIAMLVMAVGYAAFSTNIQINGTANITSTWKVIFSNIEQVSKSSGVTVAATPTAAGTSATFNVVLNSPGDSIEYKITVENQGTLDAIIDNITASETGSDAINFEIANIKVGDSLAAKSKTTFNVTISYNSNITSQPSVTTNNLTLNINYVQNVGQTITPEEEDVVIGPILPDGYQRLEYIESDGTQYIDTGYYNNTNTKVKMKVLPTLVTMSTVQVYYGSWNGNNNYYVGKGMTGNFHIAFTNGAYQASIPISQESYAAMKEIEVTNTNLNVNGISAAVNSYTYTDTLTSYLFARHQTEGAAYFSSMKLYNCQIYDNNVLKRWFVPSYRISDGATGLYDMIGQNFYTNKGTGTFTRGPEISL